MGAALGAVCRLLSECGRGGELPELLGALVGHAEHVQEKVRLQTSDQEMWSVTGGNVRPKLKRSTLGYSDFLVVSPGGGQRFDPNLYIGVGKDWVLVFVPARRR